MLYLYLPLSIMYMEILLRLLCGYQALSGILYALLISFGAGLLISAIAVLFPAAAYALTGILSAVFALEYFMYNAYKVFMSFETIFLEAGNVLNGFSGVVVSTIITGIPVIIGFFLPLILFIPLARKVNPFKTDGRETQRKRTLKLAAMFVFTVLFTAIIRNGNEDIRAAHSAEYSFDSSSRRLGILAGIGLDIRYSIFGSPVTADMAYFTEKPNEEPPYGEPSEETVIYIASRSSSATLASMRTSPGAPENDPPEEPEKPEEPLPTEYGYNAMPIDFDTLITNEKDDKIKSIHEYAAALTPSRQNEYTGIFAGKNLILITAEAFSKEVVDAEMTPTLYRLVHEGFYFSDYYQPAWGGSTSSGEFSVLSGLVPTSGAKSIKKTIDHNLCFTIGNKLMSQGYFSASYHNGSYTVYGRNKTHENFGYSTFEAFGNGFEGFTKNKSSDFALMNFTLPQYIDKQPFSVYYMTYSGHGSYSKARNGLVKKNWGAFPQFDGLSDPVRSYLSLNLELEYALQYIISELESAGIADDTVIALSTDHYPYCLTKSDAWYTYKDYLGELYGFNFSTSAERDHSALIIWSGCLENEYKDLAIDVSTPTYSLDILPTLCNLFGVEYDSRLLVGRDVFSDAEPLVLWLDRSFKTDLGYYNAPKKTFTPASPDMIAPNGYVDSIKSIVSNKIFYSGVAVDYDYFNILFNPGGTMRSRNEK